MAISRIRLPGNTPVLEPHPMTYSPQLGLANAANVDGIDARLWKGDFVFLGNTAHFPRGDWDWRSRIRRNVMCPQNRRYRPLDTCVWPSYPAGGRWAVSRAWAVPETPPSAFRGDVHGDGGHARWRNRRRQPHRYSDRRGSKRPNSDFRYSATSQHLLRVFPQHQGNRSVS